MEHSRQVQFDRQLLEVYLVGLQSEVEAKLREVTRFRENMQHLAVSRTAEGRDQQLEAAEELVEQIDRMLGTNKVVRETLAELAEAAKALARDLRNEGV
jgi:DNA-binding transcriptional regulator GbsR (MarR family)